MGRAKARPSEEGLRRARTLSRRATRRRSVWLGHDPSHGEKYFRLRAAIRPAAVSSRSRGGEAKHLQGTHYERMAYGGDEHAALCDRRIPTSRRLDRVGGGRTSLASARS